MQLIRASERGVNIVPPYCRRLLGLMLIGLAHSLLLRNGDILVPYAAVGFVLLLFRNASNIALLAGAIFGAALPFIARSLWDASGVPFPSEAACGFCDGRPRAEPRRLPRFRARLRERRWVG